LIGQNHQNGEEYQSIFENSIEGIFQSSMEGQFLKVNPAMARIYGYDSPDEMLTTITQIEKQIYVDIRERKRFLESLEVNDHVEKFQAQNYRKDSAIIWTQTNARIVRDTAGNALYIEGFVTEITSRKETELALRASEERYRALVEHLPAVVFLDTTDGFQNTLYISPKIENLLGYTPEEWIADPFIWRNSLHPDDKEQILAENDRTNKQGEIFSVEYRIRKKDGTYLWVREESSLILDLDNEPLYWQGFLSDISEQKKAEKKLQKSGEQFKKIFQANPIASCIATLNEGKYIAANDAFWKLTGFQPYEIIGRTSKEIGILDEQRRIQFVERLKKFKTIHNEDGRLITKSGEIRNTLEFFDLIVFDDQECVLGMFHDITDKVNAQKALQESEERFRLSFNTSPDSININRLEDGLYVDINEGFTAATGYKREEVIGKTSLELNIWEEPEEHKKLVEILLKEGFVNNQETKFRTKEGRVLTGLMSASIITLDGTPHVISTTRNIETLKQAEATLQRQLRELTILHNISTAASASTSVDDLLQRTTDIIADTLLPANCGIELVSDNGDTYQTHPSYRGTSKLEIRMPLPISKGVTGKVIRTGTLVRLGKVSDEPVYIEVTHGVQSELCLPIRIQDRVIGAINIESKKMDAFDEADERLFNTIAGTLATSIEQLRLLETSKRRLQELTIINSVALTATRATSVDEIIENITEIIGNSLYPDNFGILLLNDEGSTLSPHPSYRGITSDKFPSSLSINKGISGQVARSGKAQRVANVRNHPAYIEVTSQVRSELCVPIILGEKVLGIINAESVQIDLFTENDERLLTTIASTLATALEKLRLLAQEKKRRQDAEILREATTALTSSLDLPTLLDAILENLHRIVPYDSASIAMERDDGIYIVAGRGFPEGYDVIGKQLTYSKKWLPINTSQQAFIVPDVHFEPDFEQWEGSNYIRGWMGVPMLIQGKRIGFLNLDSRKPNSFTEKDAILVQTFASSAAVTIENARLFNEEQEQMQRSNALLDLMRIAATSLELEKVLQAILSYTTRLIPSDSGSVQLLEHDSLRVVTAMGQENEILVPGNLLPLESFPLNAGIIREKQPVRIGNVFSDEKFAHFPGSEKVRSFLGIPLIIKNKAIGLINLGSYTLNNFSDSDMVLALAIANHAAFAIENARLFEAEQRRLRESETLRQATLAITTSLELESVLETILIVMKQVVPYHSASVLLLEGDELCITAIQGFSNTGEILNKKFPAADELFSEIKKSENPVIIKDIRQDIRFKNWANSDIVRSWMGIALMLHNEVIGCITLDSENVDAYNETLASLSQAFANQAASAIQNARQFEAEQLHFQEAESLRQTAETLSSTLDVQQVLMSTLDNLILVVPFDSASVFLVENNKLRLTAAKGTLKNNSSIGQLFPADNPLTQEIIRSRTPLILEDAHNDPRFERWGDTDQVRGWMGVPLTSRGNMIGLLTIDSLKVDTYTEHHATLAATFAHQATAAIENARLYERGEQQIRQLTILRDIDSAISSSFDLRVTLNLVIGHIIRELGVDAAAILLYNPGNQSLSLFTSSGLTLKRNSSLSYVRIGESLAGQVALQRKYLHIPNLNDATSNCDYLNHLEESFTSYLGFPLIGKGQIKGVMEIYTKNEIDPSLDSLNFLQTLAGQAAIAIDNVQMFKTLQRSNQELMLAYDITLEGWGRALELRDKETKGHTNRVVELTLELARRMGISGEELTHLMRGTLLHDIGKLGVPDSILQKPGPLTEAEWKVMRQHPQYAYDMIYPIVYLRPALEIPYCHHERWDGSGYPRGLKGENIPLVARIFAVIDIWDALLYERVYRKAWPEEKVLEYLKNTAGIELDPTIVKTFLELLEEKHSNNRAD